MGFFPDIHVDVLLVVNHDHVLLYIITIMYYQS